jgi:hypothetical protein
VPDGPTTTPWPGPTPHPVAAYVKALLVKLCEHKAYIIQLRNFSRRAPLLVLELGFRPVLDPTHFYGFDVERTGPGARWLRHQQRTLDPTILHGLLRATVQVLQQAIPDLGTTAQQPSHRLGDRTA